MKTSFYFVLWILIYPILGLLDNAFIDNNAFIVALAAVLGLSWLLNRAMPDTLAYERASEAAPMLEDVFSGNVASFTKRLSRDTNIEIVTAIYFIVTTIVIGFAIFKAGINDWLSLAIFGFFTFGAITRSATLTAARARLKENPTPEQCSVAAEQIYRLDYEAYSQARYEYSYSDMLPPKPKHYKAFKAFSIAIAAIAALLGLLYIVIAIIVMLSRSSLGAGAVASMYFLYGSLASYFGIKDLMACIRKNKYAQ